MPNSLHSADYQIFREMLVEARQESGITQVVMAEKLGKPQSYVSKYERGERRLDFPEFMAVSDALGLDVSSFISRYRKAIKKI